MIRINKYIAQSGFCSRRKADELIEKGEVKVNGETTSELGLQIDPSKDKIEIRDHLIKPQEKLIYLALNKPKYYLTTMSDPFGRKTVIDLVPKEHQGKGLKPIGRLDFDTEGLLVFTNDLELINEFTHPKFEKEKEYFVELDNPLDEGTKEKIEEGFILEDKETLPTKITQKSDTTLTITLKEGRKRQIKKMFKHFDLSVIYLQRIRIGKLTLGKEPLTQLPIGKTQLIDKKCLQV